MAAGIGALAVIAAILGAICYGWAGFFTGPLLVFVLIWINYYLSSREDHDQS